MRLDLEPIRKRVEKLSYHWLPDVGERDKHEISLYGQTLTNASGRIVAFVAQAGDAEFFRNARMDVISLLSELVYFRSRTAKAEPILHIMEGHAALSEGLLSQMASSEITRLMDLTERFTTLAQAERERRAAAKLAQAGLEALGAPEEVAS